MKKKLITILLSLFALSSCTFALTACGEPPHEHSYTTQITSPTCTEQGFTTFTCECGDEYDGEFVNALGHDYTPTYTWDGTQVTASATCANDNTHVVTETVTATYVKDTNATCTTAETGHYEANFTNTTFTTQSTTENGIVVGEELGHNFGTPTYVWNNNQCTATRVCSRDNTHVETEMVTATYVKDTDATCTTSETGHYEATFTNVAFEDQATLDDSVTNGTPLNHDFVTSYTWTGDVCTARKVCLNDSSHFEEESATATYVKDTDATLKAAETGHYEVVFENGDFEPQSTAKDSVVKGLALGEVEGFNTPDTIAANYHFNNSTNAAQEYNPFRGIGSYVYVTNSAGDYLDAEGNILYKKVNESTTENRIAYYKKADAQATEYDVLAYYLSLDDYYFYDAEGVLSKTKEGCVRAKDENEVDISFNGKKATIGQEWYEEYTDGNDETRYGVIKAYYSEHNYSTGLKQIYLKSTHRDTEFLRNYNGDRNMGWLENPEFDYVSIWMLIQPKDGVTTSKTTVSVYSYYDFNITKVPVNQWFEYKLSKADLRQMNYPYYYFSKDRTQQQGSYITIANQDAYDFDFYFDSIYYVKGADITTGTSSLVMGQPLNLDIENCGEFTKDDFIFYIGKAENILNKDRNYNSAFFTDHVIATNATYVTELQTGKISQKYYVQAKLNADAVIRNGGEQIYASTMITVYNIDASLSSEELGQEVTITASFETLENATFTYFYKETSATEWTALTDNKFTPSRPTSYDVKVVATKGDVQVERICTKDYTKAITISVLPATGDDKLIINKDLTIVTELTGSTAITIAVEDSEGNPVTVTDGVFNVSKIGTYTIIASTTFNGVAIENTLEVRVAGLVDVEASIAETATIGVTESLEITATTDSEYTLEYLVKLPTGTIITLDSNVLPVEFVGVHEIYVTANKNGQLAGEAVLTTTISAMTNADVNNTGVIAMFGYDGAEIAAWNGTVASNKGLTTFDSIANGTLADEVTTWTADWHESLTDVEGVTKYGVISTRSVAINAKSDVANGIYVRSDVTTLTASFYKPFYGTLAYQDAEMKYMYNAIQSETWNYISIPVYVEKTDAEEGETHTLYTIYRKQSFVVPYNTWTEIKISKEVLLGNMTSYRPYGPFLYTSRLCTSPLFYMSKSTDDANKLASDKDLKIYMDSIKVGKYDDEEFTSANFVFTNADGSETGAVVGGNPQFATTSYNANKTYANCSYYIKPELYVGETLIALEDIVVEYCDVYQLVYNSATFANTKIVNVTQLGLSNGQPRTNTSFMARFKYTDIETGKVYRANLMIVPKFTLPPATE